MRGSPPYRFSDRMKRVPPSFLGELFRVSSEPGVISFAGGLPDSSLFDLEGIRDAAACVFSEEGRNALQYTTTDGHSPLREWIAARYRNRLGIPARKEEIQIVNGSQQCLDLVAKILVNPGDPVLIERPGYLGAIEAFSFYEPVYHPVPPSGDHSSGPDLSSIRDEVRSHSPAFFYGIPNSQNPSGMSWDYEHRREVAEILDGTGVILYEDDAFGELFFDGKPRVPVKKWLPEQTIMTGSFSKTISPGLRCGWIWAPRPIIEEFNRAKQAADLHSNLPAQMILSRYLTHTDCDPFIRRSARIYGERSRLMSEIIDDRFPGGVSRTRPEGGMFMMLTIPPGVSSMQVFEEGVRQGVAVMPGLPFYVDGGGTDTIRLNFSASGEEQIKTGMERLSQVIRILA
jgi:2-aminoadipate transaminase